MSEQNKVEDPELIYQVQFDDENGTSTWHDATEETYHVFNPEHRRIVSAYKASVEQAPVAQEVTQQAAKAETDAKELAEQLRRYHELEIWDWDILLNAANMIESLAPTTSTVSATAEESRKEADWARAVAFASANQNVSAVSASGALAHPELTPMFLLNAALCIEGEGTPDKRTAIIEKLGRIAEELHAATTAAQAATDKSED